MTNVNERRRNFLSGDRLRRINPKNAEPPPVPPKRRRLADPEHDRMIGLITCLQLRAWRRRTGRTRFKMPVKYRKMIDELKLVFFPPYPA